MLGLIKIQVPVRMLMGDEKEQMASMPRPSSWIQARNNLRAEQMTDINRI